MILIGLGANLPSERHGAPERTLEAALALMAEGGVTVRRRSRWYRAPPVPDSDQPWYVNGVAVVETGLSPISLLGVLQATERALGRVRRARWDSRVVDLDLLAYGTRVIGGRGRPGESPLTVPHPRLHERLFVLIPLVELDRRWRHPLFGKTAGDLLAALPPDPRIGPLDD